ncbi:hypothetical protein MAR_013966, partial [Mya arenaria]
REGRVGSVRSKYLLAGETGYHQGNFTDTEAGSVVKVTEERVRTYDALVESQRTLFTERQAETATMVDRNRQLLSQISEKNEQIRQLEKSNNVLLWEQEKKRVLASAQARIEELEHEDTDSSFKAMRLKNQMLTEKGGGEETAELTSKLSQQNFMQDKDIMYLEKQLYDLQTATVGVIGGIKSDFSVYSLIKLFTSPLRSLSGKFVDKDAGEVDAKFRILAARMDRVYRAVAENNMEKAKDALPPHYKYIEDDNFKVKKIRRLSMIARAPSQKTLSNILDDKKPILSPIPQGAPSDPEPGTSNTRAQGAVGSCNPVLIDPKTRRLHSINPLKYFPFMSPAFIQEQYDKFREYDKNGDGSLDLSEMIDCVKKLGFDFNQHQLLEGMEEVDKDGNHTLDFFEYMLVIDGIYRKNGKAELFREGHAQVRKKNMSKTCSIQ